MRNKIFYFLLFFMVFSTLVFSDFSYQPINQNIFAKVNNETLSEELLVSRSQIVYLLSDMSTNYQDFYTVLTNTATGIELIQTYLNDQAMKIINQVLFVQFVEQKGIDLERESLRNEIENQFSNVFKDAGIPDENIEEYLLLLGYTSKSNFIDDFFYQVLYNDSIMALYEFIFQQQTVSEEEILTEYNNNKPVYKSRPSADIKIVVFNTEEEASYTYTRIIEGYYTFEEVFELSDNNVTTNISLEDELNNLVNTVKNNPPGYITEPILYNTEDNTFALLKIEKKYPERQLSFEEARNQIIFNLKDKKTQEYFDKVLPEEFEIFRKNSVVIINSELF
ncbi:hypothetical protein PW5551_08880 [Petrotoga sp. 9PW.55.5.1]|uniref:peptidyl-prolyl cis-trans isomerase n=1 Tax=Petrotoga sp. 9PW.55.5.1 TaxID=1308979 RepID=UPI000DC4B59F|nr:peptidyl-prolyl cis-trans isomerase [Petrotoga sp. 9PW.55.5.1]RAO98587.1 hypothetical protein PW5551_08880 [Petrotoga sp. 9PW.55.5.1]